MENELIILRQEAEAELKENILSYWMKAIDETNGGF